MAGRWRMESIGGAFSSASTYNPTSYHASLAFLDFFPTFSLLLLPSFYSLPRVSTTFSTFIPSLTLSFVPISFFLFPSPFPSLSSSARRDRQVSFYLSLSLSFFPLLLLSIDVAALYNHGEKSRSIRDPFAKAHLQTANGPTFRFPYSSTYSTYITF